MSDDVANFEINHTWFLNKSSLMYGASGSGKSVIIMAALKALKPFIDQIVVFAPTDPSNQTYSKRAVPKPYIHYNVSEKIIEDIWERQEAFTAVYKKANDLTHLGSLFRRLNLRNVNMLISKIESTKREHIEEVYQNFLDQSVRDDKIEKLNEQFNDILALIYKKYIAENLPKLKSHKLNKDELHCLKYLYFNPKMVMVFDDCAAELKKIQSKPIIRKLFYQARHVNISLIIACQDDKDLDSSLKKNAFLNFFCDPVVTEAFFTRGSVQIPKETKKKGVTCAKTIFQGHQKLAYNRETQKFYKVNVKRDTRFVFSEGAINMYADKIQTKGVKIPKSNKFGNYFTETM